MWILLNNYDEYFLNKKIYSTNYDDKNKLLD